MLSFLESEPQYAYKRYAYKKNMQVKLNVQHTFSSTYNAAVDCKLHVHFDLLVHKNGKYERDKGDPGSQNMLSLLIRTHPCGVNTFYGMSKFRSSCKDITNSIFRGLDSLNVFFYEHNVYKHTDAYIKKN